jgi:type II secretory pathway pseudopilin PulG
MKKIYKKILGVTLLEILLVLAIAAMIIVMSVRYYQSSTASQQANSTLEQIQAITAAADGMAQANGSYASVSTGTVKVLMPNELMTSAWGGTITVTGGTSNTYTVTFSSMPGNVCHMVTSRLGANSKFSTSSTCAATGSSEDFVYTYNSQS